MRRAEGRHAAHDILESANWLLTGFNYAGRSLAFVETNRDILVSSPFIDGRAPLSITGRVASVDLDEAVEWTKRKVHAPSRVIAHSGFCGSTLLTRLLDASGACLTYREPDVLVQLSSEKVALAGKLADWQALLQTTAAQFRKSFTTSESAIVKPSNWVLNLVPDLCLDVSGTRVVFVTMDAAGFLIAVLRGGKDRLDYILKFVSNVRKDLTEADGLIAAVETDRSISVTQRVLRFALIALAVQKRAFEDIARQMPPGRCATVTYAAMTGLPAETLSRVRGALDLGGAEWTDGLIADTLGFYSKAPSVVFSKEEYDRANAWIRQYFGVEIERALNWGGKKLSLY